MDSQYNNLDDNIEDNNEDLDNENDSTDILDAEGNDDLHRDIYATYLKYLESNGTSETTDNDISDTHDDISVAAGRFWEHGYKVVLAHGKKGVHDSWQMMEYANKQDVLEDFRVEGANLGIRWDENLVDVDLELPLAVKIAGELLPKTGFVWGREKKRESHYAYRLKDGELPKPHTFAKFGNNKLILELRTGRKQSIIPPSTHPDVKNHNEIDDRYVWGRTVKSLDDVVPLEIGAGELLVAVQDVVVCTMFAELWGGLSGNRHHTMLGLCGLLIKEGRTADRVRQIVDVICRYGGDRDVNDRMRVAESTIAAYANGDVVGGLGTIAEAIGEDIVKWLKKVIKPKVDALTSPELELNDTGNAMRFRRMFKDTLVYVTEHKKWMVWDGKRWDDRNGKNRAIGEAIVIPRMIRQEALQQNVLADRQQMFRHGVISGNANKLGSMVEIAQSLMAKSDRDFDTDDLLFNVQNGVIDLRTMELMPHDPKFYIRKVSPMFYVRGAKCPKFEKFVLICMDGDLECVRYLKRIAGYMLTGLTGEQCFFFYYGASGGNGKTTYTETLGGVLGNATYGGYSSKAAFGTLLKMRDERAPNNDLASMVGLRMISSDEPEDGVRWNTSVIKNMSGEDMIRARFLYGEFFDFNPSAKLVIFGNNKPKIRDQSGGFARRLRLIPFDVKISEKVERVDRFWEKVLEEEGSGILNWMLEGCEEWLKYGLGDVPEKIRRATDEYLSEENIVDRFLMDCYAREKEGSASIDRVFKNFALWCEKENERVFSMAVFKQRLTMLHLEIQGAGMGMKVKGIKEIPAAIENLSMFNI